jgi:hypothetical protein
MRYLRRFNEQSIYDADWNDIMPEKMIVIDGGRHEYQIGNVMKNADMIQVTYQNTKGEWGIPDTLEFDFYFIDKNQLGGQSREKITLDITWGDMMACEITIEQPNKVEVVEYTSYRSKMDPSNTVFALDDESLNGLISALNKFTGIKVDRSQFNFLDAKDNWSPE